MNQEVINIIDQLDFISVEEQELLMQELIVREIKKNEIIQFNGKICSHVWFVISGSFYQYNFDTDYNLVISNLFIENEWFFDFKSFISRFPSEYTVKAFEPSLVYELSFDSISRLLSLSKSFMNLGAVLIDRNSRADLNERFKTSDDKYKFLLSERPGLHQKFPQHMIASYLKMTPETLSRVRRRVFDK